MKRLMLFTAIVVAASFVTYYLISRDENKPKFTGDWVLTEGIQATIPDTTKDGSVNTEFNTDSVKYVIYYGRIFVSEEEVKNILADQRKRCADVINYYK